MARKSTQARRKARSQTPAQAPQNGAVRASAARRSATLASSRQPAPIAQPKPAHEAAHARTDAPSALESPIPPDATHAKSNKSNGATPKAAPVDVAAFSTSASGPDTAKRARATAVLPAPPETIPEAPPAEWPEWRPSAIEAPALLGARLRQFPHPREWRALAWNWLRGLSLESWAWIAILTLAAVLRFWGLGDKPLHHDESMHAFFSLDFARAPSSYWYDPLLHGPFQFHAEGIIFAMLIAGYAVVRWLAAAQGAITLILAAVAFLVTLGGAVLAFRAARQERWERLKGIVAGFIGAMLLIGGLMLLVAQAHRIAAVDPSQGIPWINDTTARLLPATTGLFLVAITYGLRRELSGVGALAAAFALAISPAFVYFSRFLREDIYFACFTYAVVVCAVQWARKRSTGWLIATVLAFVLAYATKEAIYLNLVIWGSFLVLLAVWEIGHYVSDRLPRVFSARERAFFGHAAPLLLLGAIGSAAGAWALHQINQLSHYVYTVQLDPNSAAATQMNQQVSDLENTTVALLLYASIALALLVIVVLVVQLRRDLAPQYDPTPADQLDADMADLDGGDSRPVFATSLVAGLRARLSAERHPFLRLLLDTTWVNWFVAFVAGWVLFVALYWIVPPGPNSVASTFAQGFQVGVGRGIWQGLYYWLQQQQVARGGQPWYYYLLLIPLYEQLAVVIGAVGIVYCLRRPTRFRLFLVYWFVAALAIYSWAGEKMPWLSIHILLPLMLLTGIALGWMLRTAAAGVRALRASDAALVRAMRVRLAGAVLGLTAALVLLVPTAYGMLTLTHRDAANGPHEMMVYVQTTPDVQALMDKINHADVLMYGGKHQLKIAIGTEEEWPFYWYLRDYWLDPHPSQYVYFDYPVANATAPQEDILILTQSDADTFLKAHPTGYTSHTYSLRSWWDEGYKPLPCVSTPQHTCTASDNWGTGVGVANWLTYGDNVPANGHFQLAPTVSRLWAWLWQRQPLGSDQGAFTYVLVVRDGVPMRA